LGRWGSIFIFIFIFGEEEGRGEREFVGEFCGCGKRDFRGERRKWVGWWPDESMYVCEGVGMGKIEMEL
jgi:hypothetical protein